MASVLGNCERNGARTSADQSETGGDFRGGYESQKLLGIAEAAEITGMGPRSLREMATIIPGASKGLTTTNTPLWQFDEALLRGWVAGTVEDVRTTSRRRTLARKYPCDIYMNRPDMRAWPNKPNRIYFIGCESGHIKIGLAFNPTDRRNKLQQGCPLKLTLLSQREGSRQVEMYLHEFYAKERHRGEWFHASARLKAYIAKLESDARDYLEGRNKDAYLQTLAQQGDEI